MLSMMLCKKGTEADIRKHDGKWLGSRKIDGIRCIALCNEGKAYLSVRNDDRPYGLGRIINQHYPEIIKNLRGLEGAFDGELQCEDFITTMKRNRTENTIRIRSYVYDHPATFYIFDLLSENMALKDRLNLLNKKWTPREHIELLPHTTDLREFWKKAVKERWEGIVIKDPDSMYLHRRSDQWLKVKIYRSREVILVSYRDNDKGLMALTEDGISVQVWGYHANDVRNLIDLLGFCRAEISYFTEGAKGILRNVYLTKILRKSRKSLLNIAA